MILCQSRRSSSPRRHACIRSATRFLSGLSRSCSPITSVLWAKRAAGKERRPHPDRGRWPWARTDTGRRGNKAPKWPTRGLSAFPCPILTVNRQVQHSHPRTQLGAQGLQAWETGGYQQVVWDLQMYSEGWVPRVPSRERRRWVSVVASRPQAVGTRG